ncbi:Anaphase-promoting complex subunit 3 [Smittium mucronatum]|uniref:Anaphase-promoting complex subunit 3 n=1 Tax=Smittium mucronatum TaxID=133383 RepID=A0A1R0GWZ7_9FUNG|nr:Anaphase-promoting complex subunit 3 [Smittium mucronatum]
MGDLVYERLFYESLISNSIDQLRKEEALYYAEQYNTIFSSDIDTSKNHIFHSSDIQNQCFNPQYSRHKTINDTRSLYYVAYCHFQLNHPSIVYEILKDLSHEIKRDLHKTLVKEKLSLSNSILVEQSSDLSLPQIPKLKLNNNNRNTPSQKEFKADVDFISVSKKNLTHKYKISLLWLFSNSCFDTGKYIEAESFLSFLSKIMLEIPSLGLDHQEYLLNRNTNIGCPPGYPKISSIFNSLGTACAKLNKEKSAANHYQESFLKNPFCRSAWISYCLLRVPLPDFETHKFSFQNLVAPSVSALDPSLLNFPHSKPSSLLDRLTHLDSIKVDFPTNVSEDLTKNGTDNIIPSKRKAGSLSGINPITDIKSSIRPPSINNFKKTFNQKEIKHIPANSNPKSVSRPPNVSKIPHNSITHNIKINQNSKNKVLNPKILDDHRVRQVLTNATLKKLSPIRFKPLSILLPNSTRSNKPSKKIFISSTDINNPNNSAASFETDKKLPKNLQSYQKSFEIIVNINLAHDELSYNAIELNIENSNNCLNSLKKYNLQDTTLVNSILAKLFYELGNYKLSLKNFKLSFSRSIFSKDIDIYSSLLWQLKDQTGLIDLFTSLNDRSCSEDLFFEKYVVLANLFSLQGQATNAIHSLLCSLQVIRYGSVYSFLPNNIPLESLISRPNHAYELDLGIIFSQVMDYTSIDISKCKSIHQLSKLSYIYSLLGFELSSIDQLEYATLAFTTSIRIYKHRFNSFYGLGMLYLRNYKLDLSQHYLEKSYKLNSSNPLLACSLGMVNDSKKSFDIALQFYKLSIIKSRPIGSSITVSDQPTSPFLCFVLFRIANIYFRMKKFDKSLLILSKLVPIYSTFIHSSSSPTTLEFQIDENVYNYSEKVSKPIHLAIQKHEFFFLLGQNLLVLGKKSQANICFKQVLSNSTKDPNQNQTHKEKTIFSHSPIQPEINLSVFAENICNAIDGLDLTQINKIGRSKTSETFSLITKNIIDNTFT